MTLLNYKIWKTQDLIRREGRENKKGKKVINLVSTPKIRWWDHRYPWKDINETNQRVGSPTVTGVSHTSDPKTSEPWHLWTARVAYFIHYLWPFLLLSSHRSFGMSWRYLYFFNFFYLSSFFFIKYLMFLKFYNLKKFIYDTYNSW